MSQLEIAPVSEQYQKNVPGLKLLRTGYWDDKDGFDRSHWWLLEKQ